MGGPQERLLGHIRKRSAPGQRVTSDSWGECIARDKRALSKLREHPDFRHGQRKKSPGEAEKDQGVGGQESRDQVR